MTERRSVGDRREGSTAHVTVDGLSNGAKLLIETLIQETRDTGREVKEELNDARKSVAKWAMSTIVIIGIAVAGSIWGAAIWSQKIEERAGVAIDVREFVEQRTNELAEELAANGAGDELTRSAQLQNAVEFKTELEALRRDIERIDGHLERIDP